jgi:ring-1,2-phenylacetyl-CoA epoxidase subunit PaaC
LLLVEQPNGDFADTIARQYLYDAWHLLFLEQLTESNDTTLAAIAAKSIKEVKYHNRHSSMWIKRLGDGTEVSHQRMQDAIAAVWPFTAEMFIPDELDQRMLEFGTGVDLKALKHTWDSQVSSLLVDATLSKPVAGEAIVGGRQGQHAEYLGDLLEEMQSLPRSMPNHQW